MQTALLMIDVQESFPQRPYWSQTGADAFLKHANALIDGAQARGIPIVRVFHTDGPQTPDNPFAHLQSSVDHAPAFAPPITVSAEHAAVEPPPDPLAMAMAPTLSAPPLAPLSAPIAVPYGAHVGQPRQNQRVSR